MTDTDRNSELFFADYLEEKSKEFLFVSKIFTTLQVLLLVGLLFVPGKEALIWMLGGIILFQAIKLIIRLIRMNFKLDRERILNEL